MRWPLSGGVLSTVCAFAVGGEPLPVRGPEMRRCLLAAVLSGVPLTASALAAGGDALRVRCPGLRRYLLATVLSGVPSTAYAVATGDDPLRATRAAGSLVRGGVGAGVVVHLAVSAFWTFVLTRLRARGVVGGVAAGLVIAALDLEVIGRHNPRIRALPRVPQWLDHVAFGVLVAGQRR